MAKKKSQNVEKIAVEDITVKGVYKTYTNDVVRIEKKNEERKEIVLYNISGNHRQWVDFKHIYLVEKLYQSR